jgi:hypothetical protein
VKIIPFEQKHTIPLIGVGGVRPYGPAWTALDDLGVVACGGVNIAGKEGEAWIIIRDHDIPAAELHLRVMSKLGEVVRDYGVEKLHAYARFDWPLANDWLVRLGFVPTTADADNQYYVRT